MNGTINPSFTGRLEGAQGLYDFGINVDLDLICYAIKLVGFRGDYQSPAKTATHVHSATKGKNGPPRLAFQNPIGDEYERNSLGCMQGKSLPVLGAKEPLALTRLVPGRFTTGLVMEGKDTGEGFTVSQIEANPIGFMADVHSSLAVPGAVRGQFS